MKGIIEGHHVRSLIPDGERTADMKMWQVLHVISNHEKKVARQLAMRSLEYYLPMYKERSRWTDRTVELERPLFAGYVFVRASSQSRRSIISTPGVLRLLGESEGMLVTEVEIERIRNGIKGGYLLRPHPQIVVGTRVRIQCGVFSGAEGNVAEFRRQCKVVIALAAIHSCFSVEVPLEDIEVLGDCMLRSKNRPQSSACPASS